MPVRPTMTAGGRRGRDRVALPLEHLPQDHPHQGDATTRPPDTREYRGGWRGHAQQCRRDEQVGDGAHRVGDEQQVEREFGIAPAAGLAAQQVGDAAAKAEVHAKESDVGERGVGRRAVAQEELVHVPRELADQPDSTAGRDPRPAAAGGGQRGVTPSKQAADHGQRGADREGGISDLRPGPIVGGGDDEGHEGHRKRHRDPTDEAPRGYVGQVHRILRRQTYPGAPGRARV